MAISYKEISVESQIQPQGFLKKHMVQNLRLVVVNFFDAEIM